MLGTPFRPIRRSAVGSRGARRAVFPGALPAAFLATLLLAPLLPSKAQAQALAETYFVPVDETHLRSLAEAINTSNSGSTGAPNPDTIRTVISITSTAAGTVLYYDHWEDGYERDLANPIQGTTEIFNVGAGTVTVLENDVFIDPRDSGTVLYDARDRIGSTELLAVTRAGWRLQEGTLLAGAAEAFPQGAWGTTFEVPVGEDLGPTAMFQYTALSVMAGDLGAVIAVDDDGDGNTDTLLTLNPGETSLIEGVESGARLTSSDPIQAHILTGDRSTTYEARWFVLVPREQWDNSYFNPTGTTVSGDETTVILYNPGASAITVTHQTNTGTISTGTVSVPAGGTTEFTMPLNSGARFFTAGEEPFFAIAAIDDDGTTHDWGFTLLPEESLTTTLVAGWAPGRDPTSGTNPTENGSPIWLIANSPTDVYVDYDGDPATGPLVDGNGDRYDLLLTVDELESVRIFDPDGDQSGMRLYTLDGSLIMASWGQDPAAASAAAPGLDLGTTVLPIKKLTIVKEGLLFDDVDGDGGVDPGDTLTYRILVTNVSSSTITDVVVEDTDLDVNVEYVAGSTEVGGADLPDDVPPDTIFPLDEGGVNIGDLAAGQSVLITFLALVDDPFPVGVDQVSNAVEVRTTTETETDTSSVPVGDPFLLIAKTSDVVGDVSAGDVITYTVSVTNGSPVTQNGLKVLDQLPPGTTYLGESTEADGFGSVSSSVTYDEATSGAFSFAATPCSNPLVRTVNVSESLLLTDLDFGINVSHDYRGDVVVTLESPSGTRVEVISSDPGDSDNNFDVLLDDSSNNDYDDDSFDPTGVPYYSRTAAPANPLAGFAGEDIAGTWTVEICDVFSADNGTYNRSRFIFTGTSLAPVSKSNAAAALSPLLDGEPTNLVLAPDGFSLGTAQTLIVTYQVQVDNPLDVNTTNITNTAFASSLEYPFPVQATVVDPVTRGAVLGDRVWLDADGDGVQDVGEPGLANVTVELYDPGADGQPGGGDDVLVGTAVTDAGGTYLFDHLAPGDYFVDVDGTTLPAGLSLSPGATDPSAVVALAAEEERLDLDFGYRNASGTTAILGDYLWSDADADGVQDLGEIGLSGVPLRLLDSSGSVVATTTTAADGTYLFTGVSPGEYRVQVDPAALSGGGALDGYSPTSGPQSEGATTSAPVTLAGGATVLSVDFGFDNPSATFTISDAFWIDLDADASRDPGEPRIEGVTVNLLNGSGSVIATALSAADGSFSFTGVPPGDYTISVSDNGGLLVGLGGTTAPARARELAVTVTASDVSGVNFGYNAPATLGDRIWSDADGDGVQDPGERGIEGVTVELLDRGGSVIATTVTGADGSYLFEGVAPEQYTVRVDASSLPAGYVLTGDPDASADGQSTLTLGLGESDLTLDFGYQNSSLPELSGTVFNDLDEDGLEEGGEPGFEGVTLQLLDAGGTVVATTTTDASGDYTFFDLPDGNYTVAVTDTAGILDDYRLTSGLDSLTVTMAGTDVADVDFGYARDAGTGSIGDAFWLDADRDGLQGPAEAGLAGVTVELYDPGPDGAMGGGDDVLVATTVSDFDGRYVFSGLVAGSYYVDFDGTTVPAGFAETTYPGGADPGALIALSEGEDFDQADFGFVPAAGSAVGDQVWYDADGDGLQDPGEVGIGGVDVTVTGPSDTFTVATGPDGRWLVPGLAPGDYFATVDTATLPAGYGPAPTNGAVTYNLTVEAGTDYYYLDWGFNGGTTGSIGDTVFFDADGDGVQDPGEGGIEGVTLNLLDSGGNVIATTTTDDDGAYDFTGLPAGSYDVEVTDVDGVLTGLNLSTAVVGTIALAAGEDYDLADFGYAPSGGVGSIGSLVWRDTDGDGVRDPGEPGVQGVTLALWLDVDGDGVITPGTDNLLRTTTTNGNGQYELTGLGFGDYLVDVTDQAGVLAGLSLTSGAAGTNNNSQADPYAVTLSSGQPTDGTADFGYQAPSPVSLGGTVFRDDDRDASHDEPAEGTVAGATVSLYRIVGGNRFLVGTTTSDGSGDYLFTGLPDGSYEVEVDTDGTSADGYLQTTQSGTGGVQPVTLAGVDSLDNDFGFFNGGVTTTPVTLAAFYAEGNGTVRFTWTTATETGNLGFRLHVLEEGEGGEDWRRLGDELVPSHSIDSLEPKRYEAVISGVNGEIFLLEDVDVRGRSRFHGPFRAGRPYGAGRQEGSLSAASAEALAAPAIDWQEIRRQGRAQLSLRAARSGTKAYGEQAHLLVEQTGLHRITHEQLLAAGADFSGAQARNLALTNLGTSVPVRLLGNGPFWGPGSALEFLGEAMDSLYTRTNVYLLRVDPAKAEQITSVAVRPVSNQGPAESFVHTHAYEIQREYSFGAPGEDPWYDRRMLAQSGPASIEIPLEVPGLVAGSGVVELAVEVWGGTDFPQAPDHHVMVEVNGEPVADAVFDGLTRRILTAQIDADSLAADGSDVIRLVLPHDTGATFDLVNFDRYTATYHRDFSAAEGELTFRSARPLYRVTHLPSTELQAYRVEPDRVWHLRGIAAGPGEPGEGNVALLPGSTRLSTYVVTAEENVRTPGVEALEPAVNLLPGPVDFLVIAHPWLLDAVQPLVDARRAQGWQVQVADVTEVYRQYSFGVVDPEAISLYVAEAHQRYGTRHVLLVGGDTSDPLDHLGRGGMSFIPSFYVETHPVVRYAPVDPLYGDVDRDGVPEVAVGRFPARTAAEVQGMVEKTLQYEALTPPLDAVLAADAFDAAANLSFTGITDQMRRLLPGDWTVTEALLDEGGLAAARQDLIGAVNGGVGLTSYFGHSGPTLWSFQGLFTTADADALLNDGLPTLVTQWGCWTTYYVSPARDTLGHRLLTPANRGAAAVLGATTLTTADAERLFGLELFPRLGAPTTLGDAVIDAKQALAASVEDPAELVEVLYGWTLLGDPTLGVGGE